MKNHLLSQVTYRLVQKLGLLLVLLAGISFSAKSQESIDLKRIKEQTTDPGSVFFYDSLVSQFKTSPATMTLTQAQFLYYGEIFRKGFSTYGQKPEDAKTFNQEIRTGNYEKAIPLGEKALQRDPVDLELIAGLHICYRNTNQPEKTAMFEAKLRLLLSAITSSGSGQSLKEGYWVTSISDEYVFLPLMGLETIRRKGSTGDAPMGMTDIWLIKNQESGKEEELFLTVVNPRDLK
ncbi:DUF4919 domain-containing protein [Rufibacter sp. LB8]|uniref:DUF4919 domain-containing protein n=1 Tax=Rufibacter sp. LB8 TaxID=2777781 RepID=UPI00178C51F2|nr:DUF4919 domain-containing protein [Rufibacter sp. LB8]